MIPNTTQTPNCIFDYWMSRLKGGELKVLLAVVRHTIGWLEDPETGRRREKDHISHAKLVEMTGTSGDTITRAIAKLIDELGIVEALDEEENLLDNPEARRKVGQSQKPIYYRIPLEKLHLGGYPQNQDRSEETYPQNQDSHLPAKSGTRSKERKDLKKKNPTSDKPRRETVKKKDLDRLTEGYAVRKGIRPQGDEWKPIQQAFRHMLLDGNTVEQIEGCEDAIVNEGWTWTFNTVRRWMPDFRAGKFPSKDGRDAPRIQALQDAIGEIDSFLEYKIDAVLAKLSWQEDQENIEDEKRRLERIRSEKMEEREQLVSELKKLGVSGD